MRLHKHCARHSLKGLKLDFDASSLHDLVELAILLAADELAMLISKLNLKSNFVMESLQNDQTKLKLYRRWHAP